MSDSSPSSSGVGFFSLLFLLFLTLKLTGVIDWSWWWVTAPLWGASLLSMSVVVALVTLEREKRKVWRPK